VGRIRREGERSLSYDDSHIHTQGTGCLITSIRYGRLENTPETCPRFPSPNPDISSESLREFGVCPSFFRWFPCKKGGESFALRARVSIFRFSDGWHQVTSPGPFVRHYEIYESLDGVRWGSYIAKCISVVERVVKRKIRIIFHCHCHIIRKSAPLYIWYHRCKYGCRGGMYRTNGWRQGEKKL